MSEVVERYWHMRDCEVISGFHQLDSIIPNCISWLEYTWPQFIAKDSDTFVIHVRYETSSHGKEGVEGGRGWGKVKKHTLTWGALRELVYDVLPSKEES